MSTLDVVSRCTPLALSLVACLALSSCASTSPASPAQPLAEDVEMTTPGPERPATARAEQLLLTLLEVIGNLETVADITPEALGRITGLEVKFDGEGRYGAGAVLTSEWRYSFHVNPASVIGARLEFSFRASPSAANPDMTVICGLDFDQFARGLTNHGFTRNSVRGSHGEIIEHQFTRGDVEVRVGTRGRANSSTELIKHECVRTVVVH